MAKVQIKSETIATFGGIFHVMDVFERLGLGRLIDSSLGNRDSSWNAFRYSEVIETLFCNYLCIGDYAIGTMDGLRMTAYRYHVNTLSIPFLLLRESIRS